MIEYPQTTPLAEIDEWPCLSKNGINSASPEEWDRASKVKSTGGSTSYYEIPPDTRELQDLIEYKKMNYAMANIFKAAYRIGQKEGNDDMYDLKKIAWFVEREIQRRGAHCEANDKKGN